MSTTTQESFCRYSVYIFFAFTPFANYIYAEILSDDKTDRERESFKELLDGGALEPPSQHSQRDRLLSSSVLRGVRNPCNGRLRVLCYTYTRIHLYTVHARLAFPFVRCAVTYMTILQVAEREEENEKIHTRESMNQSALVIIYRWHTIRFCQSQIPPQIRSKTLRK